MSRRPPGWRYERIFCSYQRIVLELRAATCRSSSHSRTSSSSRCWPRAPTTGPSATVRAGGGAGTALIVASGSSRGRPGRPRFTRPGMPEATPTVFENPKCSLDFLPHSWHLLASRFQASRKRRKPAPSGRFRVQASLEVPFEKATGGGRGIRTPGGSSPRLFSR